MKKTVSIILVVCMVVMLLPTLAFAETTFEDAMEQTITEVTTAWNSNTTMSALGTLSYSKGNNTLTLSLKYSANTKQISELLASYMVAGNLPDMTNNSFIGDSLSIMVKDGSATVPYTKEALTEANVLAVYNVFKNKVPFDATDMLQTLDAKSPVAVTIKDTTKTQELTFNLYVKRYVPVDPDPGTGGGGGSTTVVTSPVSVTQSEGGTAVVSPANAAAGTKVTVTVTPLAGMGVDTIVIKDANGNVITVTDNGNGTYAFTMPTTKVSVVVTYKAVTAPETGTFTDVAATDWYFEAATFCNDKGIMTGTATGVFSATALYTRASEWQSLYNIEKNGVLKAATTSAESFELMAWYDEAMQWAVSAGLSDGTSPNGDVTREQMAVMLYRYAQYLKLDVTDAGMAIKEFSDFDKISDWAMDAMTWAVNAGIIKGSNNALNPGGTASRAEVAQMFMNYVAHFTK